MTSKGISVRRIGLVLLVYLLLGTVTCILFYHGTAVSNYFNLPIFRLLPPTHKTIKRVNYPSKPPWVSLNIFDECEDSCEMVTSSSYADSDVVIFHAPDLHVDAPFKKYEGQTWVFHDLEPPILMPTNFKKWKRLFNWTFSYRRDSDIFRPYGFFTHRNNTNIDNSPAIPWKNKTRNIGWIVSHCGVQSQRLKYGNELQKYIDTDIFGRCGKLHCPRAQWKGCLGNYKFYASFENSFCEDYMTEKSFNLFAQKIDSIPITRGSANYSIFLPPGSYIDTSNFSSIEKLGRFLRKLSEDEGRFKNYFHWRRYFKVNDDLNIGFCELCKRMHSPSEKYKRLYNDIDEWLHKSYLPPHVCRPVKDLV
ncbi:alpha-(1,3)-fucosyltransferase C-like [Argopecten irradians]|uniref:alpha-(1,3)-fucosyltransferase C-like n=1 Tax=Argopecten irradians TaxID=31199 RepID=UPI00371EB070